MSPVPLAPVLPCVAFNQSSCISESCGFSHFPDSFSLSSGGRNVCLLYLTGRCDGWGCSYSHTRKELAWTDEQILFLIHGHMQLIDAYNGRMARNPYPIHHFPSLFTQPAPWVHLSAPLAYPTPSSSTTIDPVIIEHNSAGNTCDPQLDSWTSDEQPVKETDESPCNSVPPDLASDFTLREPAASENMHQEGCNIIPSQAATLNPLAVPFIPSGGELVPIEEATAIPDLKMALPPADEADIGEACQEYTFSGVSKPISHDHEELPTSTAKSATVQDIDAWCAPPGQQTSWDSDPIDSWGLESNSKGAGGCYDGPTEDTFKSPPRAVVSPVSVSKKAHESFKAKEKTRPSRKDEKRTSWKEEGAKQTWVSPTTHRWPSKSDTFEKFQSRKDERRHSTPSKAQSKSNKPLRSIVIVPQEGANTSAGLWREGLPHKTPEVEDAKVAKSYKITVQPGCIIPAPETTAEIVKAHLKLSRTKPPSSQLVTHAIDEVVEVDPGVNWVNVGPSCLNKAPDPPREFSERSRVPGSTWVKKAAFPSLSEGKDGESIE